MNILDQLATHAVERVEAAKQITPAEVVKRLALEQQKGNL